MNKSITIPNKLQGFIKRIIIT